MQTDPLPSYVQLLLIQMMSQVSIEMNSILHVSQSWQGKTYQTNMDTLHHQQEMVLVKTIALTRTGIAMM